MSRSETAILAWGSNLFNQISADPPDNDDASSTASTTLRHVTSVMAACTYQTIFRDQYGVIKACGESSRLLEQACRALVGDRKHTDGLVFVGKDIFEAVLDVERDTCYFLEYEEEEGGEGQFSVTENSGWKTAAVDGRGRCMAIDLDGQVYLFDSVALFRSGTAKDEASQKLRETARFTALSFGEGGPAIQVEEGDTTQLPSFDKVSAGNAHFVLLAAASQKAKTSPVWIFGDARFGAVPIRPFADTTVVGLVSTNERDGKAVESNVSTDVPYLMPVPHFSPHEGFPSRIADISAGSRYSLVLTIDGDLYGWGWNEESPLLPFDPDTLHPNWENNIVHEPTLIPLPPPSSSFGKDDVACIAKIAVSNGRSLGVTIEGQLLVAGSNEFGCLGLDGSLSGASKKPRFEREFSQIKKEYDCVNGWQMHPSWKSIQGGKVTDVHATMLATFIMVETRLIVDHQSWVQ